MEFLILWWIVFAVAAGGISNAKGRGWGYGLAWGGLLGLIGLIVVICTPSARPSAAAAALPPPLPPPVLPPAGWYPDPAGKQRYWDGRAWSQLPPPPPAPPPSSIARPIGKAQRHITGGQP
ncbi:DUF2510 domain-containing protein [Mycobacterium celatum]|uniref:DUF2510 domain-containing protein n=1 Tax=Mycobacterium celatum TaxID=28045 RepID=A0A2G5PKL3_MYCCE|nr:DUF2510 domain-containing protein [Mycobacterium celatum]PIB78831.1 hypothetical protein CQY23_11795 [Mycobacterium celatum]